MKQLDFVLNNYAQQCMDGRDVARLAVFCTLDQLEVLGVTPNEQYKDNWPTPQQWTQDNVRQQFERDVGFAFQKALDKRGLSASMMYEVLRMWDWIFTDDDTPFRHVTPSQAGYTWYGLPFIKCMAVKHNFNNVIGDDTGTEAKYGDEAVDLDNT